MPASEIVIRKALLSDIENLKTLADAHRNELGFILRPALAKSVDNRSVLVAVSATNYGVLTGFVDYHHRRDSQTTLYHIVVASDQQGNGIGRELVATLRNEAIALGKHRIVLRCPEGLQANSFYQSLGFRRVAVENGKTRRLNVWQFDLAGNA